MNDMINRQDAIDAHCELCGDKDVCGGDICPDVEVFQLLPSAQPDIIRCKDCKWYEQPEHRIYENCVRWKDSNSILLPINPDDFCSRAERREE